MLSIEVVLGLLIIWVIAGLYMGVCIKMLNKDCFRVLDSIILFLLMLVGPIIIINNFFKEREEIIDFLVNKNLKNKSHGRRLKAKLMKSNRFAIHYICLAIKEYFKELPKILDETIYNVNINKTVENKNLQVHKTKRFTLIKLIGNKIKKEKKIIHTNEQHTNKQSFVLEIIKVLDRVSRNRDELITAI